jgi:acetyltransferase-like isoleucine patch superfamily enzyme
MEEDFRLLYEGNVVTARHIYGPIAQGLYHHYPKDKVCVKGNAIPIGKCHYSSQLKKLPPIYQREISALTLTQLTKTKDSFAYKSYERWLEDAKETYNVDVLDLLDWEDREGNWQAMSQLEWDIVQETLEPCNCRAFLINMLAVDAKHRKPPEYRFHHELISHLWPETLSEPINPHKNKGLGAMINKTRKKVVQNLRALKKHGRHWHWWWAWPAMQLSSLPYLGRIFAWLAGLPLGPHRDKRPLATITSNSYISPKAQISCSELHIGPRCFVDDFVTIVSGRRGGRVALEEKVHIDRGTIIEVNRGALVTVGAGTHIQANCIVNGLVGNVQIGRNAVIAPHCGFFSYQHKFDDLSRPMSQQALSSKGDIVIEDSVRLGSGVVVMDGVRIGRGTIVHAGTVVTQDLPPYSVAIGVPARIVYSASENNIEIC